MATDEGQQVDSYLYHLVGTTTSPTARQVQLSTEKALNWETSSSRSTLEVAPGNADEPDILKATAPESFAPQSETTEPPGMEDGIPVLVMVRNPSLDSENVAGFKPGTQLGNVITGNATVAAIEALDNDPDVLRVEISRETGQPELNVSIKATKGDVVHRPPIAEKGARALVGVIDGGIDVLHYAFRDDGGKSTIVALWDQLDTTGPAPTDARGISLYGTLHTRDDINRYIRTGVLPQRLLRDPKGHGTHVASIAAGRPAGAFAGGMAPEANLVIVIPKLHTRAGDPLSIGYSKGHVDALAFIDKVASDEGKPIAVNISLGMNASAHDGSSTLEAAFDNFSAQGRIPGRVLVKSAGNAGAADMHATFQIGDAQVVELEWVSFNTSRTRDLIELWYPSSDDLIFELVAPQGGGRSKQVNFDPGATRTSGRFAAGNGFAVTLDRFFHDNGDTRVLVSVDRGTAPGIALGNWRLIVRGRRVLSDGIVDAWIERQDGRTIEFTRYRSQERTLSVPGTAHSVICVAALDRHLDGTVMPFSSIGGTRDGRPRPDLGAPGDAIEAAKAGTDHDIVALPGTSMAAPHVAGAIALLMSRRATQGGPQLNTNQVRAALSQSARGFNGRWNAARGWGMLDVKNLLNLFP